MSAPAPGAAACGSNQPHSPHIYGNGQYCHGK